MLILQVCVDNAGGFGEHEGPSKGEFSKTAMVNKLQTTSETEDKCGAKNAIKCLRENSEYFILLLQR